MEENKKSLMGAIRYMEKGEKKVFPISKRSYILNLTSYRLKEKEPNKKWKTESDRKKGIITVIRKR